MTAEPRRRGLVGRWERLAPAFLLSFVTVTTIVFAIPFLISPVWWAHQFGWTVPANTELIEYFGRGASIFLLTFEVLWFRAARGLDDLRRGYQLLLVIVGSMILLHIWGLLVEGQPLSETVEIGGYALVFVAVLLFFPSDKR